MEHLRGDPNPHLTLDRLQRGSLGSRDLVAMGVSFEGTPCWLVLKATQKQNIYFVLWGNLKQDTRISPIFFVAGTASSFPVWECVLLMSL